jgi:phosphoribosylamine---glycine ligase
MNILIVGNGGREHALAWKIKQSPQCDRLFVAPGNGGTSSVAENVSIPVDDFPQLGIFCLQNKIELVVVGPEGPLVNGIRDYFEGDPRLKDVLMVGPGRTGAQLEGSKDFSKRFMVRHGIPTAEAKTFQVNQMQEALRYLETRKPPIVLKADGLASGKGVIISPSIEEAQKTIREMLEERKFGEASAKVLVEEFLDGMEVSVFVLTDGKDYLILPEAKDYKRIGEGDTGPNTGGMGAVSPVVFANAVFMKKVEERVIKPTIVGLQKENIPYKGFIFIGLINVDGEPYVIEYNARLGDPETEVVLPRIKNDLVDLLVATAKGELRERRVEQESFCAVTVVLVSGGYPGDYQTGKTISGLQLSTDALVFHAGTKRADGRVMTAGGRVLAVTGRGVDLKDASKNAYEGISGIGWDRLYFRKDIGLDLQNWRD